jgi:hypothetical protein
MIRTAILLLALLPSKALAWNALGHKVIADIAWQQLDEPTRLKIVRTLRRHPRFDEDFAKQAPTEGDLDRWIFQHAATWPDQIRGNRDYDMPTWHYVNFPIFVGEERPVEFNRQTEPTGDRAQWNVIQAIVYCRQVLQGDTTPADKAVAYCWLFHLVGDLHQPLHSVSLVCDRFPTGDRGGNSIPLVQGRNLHALWDNLLGRRHRLQDVAREVAELKSDAALWRVDVKSNIPAWIAESRELAESAAYAPVIPAAVRRSGELAPITLPENCLKSAGAHARRRVVAAGVRLAALLVLESMAEEMAPAP